MWIGDLDFKKRRLEAFEMRIWRRMNRNNWIDRKSDELDVLERIRENDENIVN